MGVDRFGVLDAEVDINASIENLHAEVNAVCKATVSEWADIESSKLIVSTISGGITNLLLKVSIVDDDDDDDDDDENKKAVMVEEKKKLAMAAVQAVTVRIFGQNTELFIDRQKELDVIKFLSKNGFGPTFIGAFSNGIVQSFIDARTLEPNDLIERPFISKIAKLLRNFHDLQVPGSKEPQLWANMDKFLQLARTITLDDDPIKQQILATICLDNVEKEIDQLKTYCDGLRAPVVFCHNDLLSGNLMYNEKQDKLYVIDFEYGSYGYRGFDLGNHFNEFAGFDCDYANLYPSRETQEYFIRNYLCPDFPDSVAESAIKGVYVEANAFALASHLYWGLWALLQAKYSAIDFDYLGYFFLRWNEFQRRKQEVFSLIVDEETSGHVRRLSGQPKDK